MKVFIVKYALTEGIIEAETEDVDKDMIKVKRKNSFGNEYFHKREWCDNIEDARIIAYKLKDARIKSLEKSLDKVKKLTF